MAVTTYRIRIVRAGEEFEFEGDKKFVLDLLKKYETSRETSGEELPVVEPAKGKGKGAQLAPSKGKPVSVGEFIRLVGLKRHTDITLAFGYYLETQSGLKDFAPADINSCYYDAKVEPSNTSQMIIQNIKRGFMMQSRAKGKGGNRFLLTQTGVEFINSKLKK